MLATRLGLVAEFIPVWMSDEMSHALRNGGGGGGAAIGEDFGAESNLWIERAPRQKWRLNVL